MALGIDPATSWDQSVMIYLSTKRFTHGGLDCVVEDGERRGIRESFAYFSGQSAAFIPSLSQRRQFVVLDGTDGFRVLYNANDFTSSKAPEVLEAIHSVTPESMGGENLNYAQWVVREALPESMAGADQDADDDGSNNLSEFYFGSSPNERDPSLLRLSRSAAGYQLTFPEARNREGVEVEVELSDDLDRWETLMVDEGQWTREEGEMVDLRTLRWSPEGAGAPAQGYLRLRLRLAP